jgi:hypothetical protein
MKWGLVRGFGSLGVFSESVYEVLVSSFLSFLSWTGYEEFFPPYTSLPLLSVTPTNDWKFWSSHHGLQTAKPRANKSFDYQVLVTVREICTHYTGNFSLIFVSFHNFHLFFLLKITMLYFKYI